MEWLEAVIGTNCKPPLAAEIAHQNPQFICSESTIIKARHKPFGEGLNITIEGSINHISLKPMTNGLHIDLAICKGLLLHIDQVAEAEVIHEEQVYYHKVWGIDTVDVIFLLHL